MNTTDIIIGITTCQKRLQTIIQEGTRNRTEPAEPKRTEPFNSGTGRNRTRNRTDPNRTEPDASEKRRPNRVEPG